MGIQLVQSGIGDADISFGGDDFDSPVVRIFCSVIINLSQFNGKYIANNLPPRLYNAGQVTLLHSGYVVHHEFVQFFKRDLGVYCYDPSYTQVVNVYPYVYCLDSMSCEPGSPDFYTALQTLKMPEEAAIQARRMKFTARYPDATEEQITQMVNCDTHHYLAEIAPFKLGLLKCVNQVFLEVFRPGISVMVEIAE